MKILIMAGCLVVLSLGFSRAAASDKDDQIAMVEAFLKTPTENLPPQIVPRFLAVDPEILPKKLRAKYRAKRLELYTLKQIADGNKRGFVRMPDANCVPPAETQESAIPTLQFAGFMEIKEDEEQYLIKKTQCSEQQLTCEFSLHLIEAPRKSSHRRRLFLHKKDPLFALVDQYRAGASGGQTNFFGAMTPGCPPPNN